MSALAILRDLAGCRAVLHDARLEARPDAQVADLERVVAEAEEALWDGGEAGRVDCWVYRRMAPTRPDVSAEAFDDYRYDYRDPDDPDMSYEDAHRAWADERRREYRDRVRAYLATDWLAWDDRGRRARARRGMYGEGLASFADILRDAYPAERLADLARSPGPALGGEAMRERMAAVADAAGRAGRAGREPDVLYMNPEVYARLQEQRRAEIDAGHRVHARRSGRTAAERIHDLARVYGTGAFEVPPHAFDSPIASRSDAAAALAYAYGHLGGRAATGPHRIGYRPRWALALAATLANLLTDGPASGVPGMGDL